MSLFHVGRWKELKPEELEENEYVQLLKERLNPRSFEKMIRIFDEQIQSASPSEANALTFAMLATLVGHSAECPTVDSNYVWRKVEEAGRSHTRTCNYMLGCFAQWRFSLDERKWLCYKKESGRQNEFGEEMAVTIYWVKKED